MFVKNCWYVAAWSSEITADKFLARTILNIPVVLWRDEAGKLIAFEDRCCHRGAPLSKGRKEGDCVRCMYHGLLFDKSGACIHIPGQERIPPKVRVKVFPVVERFKWSWIWMGDPEKADASLIPDTPWLDDPAWRYKEGYTHYAGANYLLIADNLLDLAHLPYVHPSTLGGGEDYAESPAKVETVDRGVRITRWTLNTAVPAFVQQVKPYAGKVDRWNIYDFLVPGIFLMDSGVAAAGTGAPQGNRVDAAEFHGCQALTPETEHSTHYFFCHPHNFAIDRPDVTESVHQSVITAFEEDKEMVSAQAQSLRLDPSFKMIPIAADGALGRFRHLIDSLLKEEAADQASSPGNGQAVVVARTNA